MGFKKTNQFWLIQNGVMTGVATLTSPSQFVGNLDNLGLQFEWSGTPNGTFNVSGNVGKIIPGTPTSPWESLTFSPGIQNPAGSASGFIMNLNQFPWPLLQVTYTNTSSTGVLNVYLFGKDLN